MDCVVLPHSMDVAAAEMLWREGHARLRSGASVRLNGESVSACGAAGAQAVLALAHLARDVGGAFSIAQASPALRRALTLCGFYEGADDE